MSAPATAEQITLTCQDPQFFGLGIAVSGTLTPAIASAPITITYKNSSGQTVETDRAITTSGGSYSNTSHFTATGVAEPYTITAQYPGDSTHGPSNTATCTVHVS